MARGPIDLTEGDLNLLRQALANHAAELLDQAHPVALRALDPDTANGMREAVAKELSPSGLEEHWVPTQRGLELESLIDQLGRAVY